MSTECYAKPRRPKKKSVILWLLLGARYHNPVFLHHKGMHLRLTVKERFVLTFGTLQRAFNIHFRPGYVRRQLQKRKGECRHTGACCWFTWSYAALNRTCLFLEEKNSLPICEIHDHKLKNCQYFPINKFDLRCRNIVLPDDACGYKFP